MVSGRCSLLRFDKHATATRDANVREGWAQGVPELSRARTVDEVLPYHQGANVGSRVGKKKILVMTMVHSHRTEVHIKYICGIKISRGIRYRNEH